MEGMAMLLDQPVGENPLCKSFCNCELCSDNLLYECLRPESMYSVVGLC